MSVFPDRQRAYDTKSPASPAKRLRYVWLFIISFLLFLALISFDAQDAAYLAGGMGELKVINNWLGFLGAWTAQILLLSLGFSSYLLCLLLMVIAGRRFAAGAKLQPTGWDYWLAVFLFTLGFCMLFGSWPDFLGDVAEALNLSLTTGGVLGQRLCGPEGGWMQVILNPTGNALVATILILVGFGVVWIYDWHELVMEALGRRTAGLDGIQEPVEPEPLFRLTRHAAEATPAKAKAPDKEREAASRPEPRPLVTLPVQPQEKKEKPEKNDRKKEPAAADKTEARPGTATAAPAKPYVLPAVDLLNQHDDRETAVEPAEVEQKKQVLQATLNSFGIDAKVGDATCGPRVTLFEVLPAPGVKVERISQISNNIAMELRALSLRILTPIPGRNTVGIEVPNAKSATVSLRGLMQTHAWKNTPAIMPLLLGRNIRGEVVILDLTKSPHLLIAGATGSGKSVCINALIVSLLYRFSPEELRLVLIDPKVVEFRAYEKLPHLVVPVISDIKKVPLALRWVIKEMERRYRVLAKVGTKNLESFNSRLPGLDNVLDDDGKPIPDRLPYIVVVIDELADIIMTAKADVETSLARIAQLSRAVGIHAIVATQRPSVNVITGTIKANFPTRIAFQVTSQVDSRTILDGKGAESLLGRGDLLYKPPGASKLERNQSAYVEDEEIDRVVEFCGTQMEQRFDLDVFKVITAPSEGGATPDEDGGPDEELIQKAIEIILRDRRPTTSYIQRCLRIGYNRSALIMEILEQRGVIGPQVGTAPREILITGQEELGVDVEESGTAGDAAAETAGEDQTEPPDER